MFLSLVCVVYFCREIKKTVKIAILFRVLAKPLSIRVLAFVTNMIFGIAKNNGEVSRICKHIIGRGLQLFLYDLCLYIYIYIYISSQVNRQFKRIYEILKIGLHHCI